MALGGCLSCIKYMMFVFNFLFWLVGCLILSLGIWVLVDSSAAHETFSATVHLKVATYILIAIGSIIMVVGFLGCCGAIRESQCMLATFFVFLFIIFAVLVALGVYLFINPEKFKNTVTEELSKNFSHLAREVHDNVDGARAKMTKIENELNCCGYDPDKAPDYVPTSATAECRTRGHTETCPDKVVAKGWEQIEKQSAIVAGVAIGIGVVMLIGMIFALMLCCAIRDTSY